MKLKKYKYEIAKTDKKKRIAFAVRNLVNKLLYSRHILARAGVDSDRVAFVDEHRDLEFIACFDGCGFCRIGRGIACDCRFANRDKKFDKVRRFH